MTKGESMSKIYVICEGFYSDQSLDTFFLTEI